MRLRPALLAAPLAALALALPAAAHANFFTAPVDGPDPAIQSLDGLDVASDATGGLVYLKQVNGANHFFVSELGADGAFHTPQQVDTGSPAGSVHPAIAASACGRLVAVWVQGGDLWAALQPAGSQSFGAPVVLYDDPGNAVGNVALDMSINGVAFAVWTAPGGSAADLHVARLQGDQWVLDNGVLDIDPARDAGATPDTAPRVAVSADGTGLVVWGEGGEIYARKVFDTRISAAPQDLGPGESPSVDVEDDSSYAWVMFRQGSQVIARREVGDQFDDPIALGGSDADPATQPWVELNGHGEGLGLFQDAGSHQVFGTLFDGSTAQSATRLDNGAGPVDAYPVGAISRNLDGVIAWQAGAPTQLFALHVDDDKLYPAVAAGDPSLGILDGSLGMRAAADRAGNVVIAYVTGPPETRRIVTTVWDRDPGRPEGHTTTHPRRTALLSWGAGFELWGPLTYTVVVDGKPVGQTTKLHFKVKGLPDGVHRWHVVATDVRGQTSTMRDRILRLDQTGPDVRLSVHGGGAVRRFTVTAHDPKGRTSSGLSAIRLYYDQNHEKRAHDTGRSSVLRVTHVYRRGKHRIVVNVRDRAGNLTSLRRTIVVR